MVVTAEMFVVVVVVIVLLLFHGRSKRSPRKNPRSEDSDVFCRVKNKFTRAVPAFNDIRIDI